LDPAQKLVANGSIARDYVRFLDHAAKRILLRKVGGGYMFIHRMLLEWFAERYGEPGTPPKKQVDSGIERIWSFPEDRLIALGFRVAAFQL
jgi:hypothetical protein